jgi:hypothetical protein
MIRKLEWGTHRRTDGQHKEFFSLSRRKVGQRAKWGFRRSLIEDSALLRCYARYVSCSWRFRDRQAVPRRPWTTNILCVTSQKSEDQDQKVELNFWNCHYSQYAYSSKGARKECFISRRKFPFLASSVYSIQSDRHIFCYPRSDKYKVRGWDQGISLLCNQTGTARLAAGWGTRHLNRDQTGSSTRGSLLPLQGLEGFSWAILIKPESTQLRHYLATLCCQSSIKQHTLNSIKYTLTRNLQLTHFIKPNPDQN